MNIRKNTDIDVGIFKNGLINVDVNINIFQKCWCIDNPYGLSIHPYLTAQPWPTALSHSWRNPSFYKTKLDIEMFKCPFFI